MASVSYKGNEESRTIKTKLVLSLFYFCRQSFEVENCMVF